LQPSGLPQRKTERGADTSAVRGNLRALTYIESADRYLEAIGYTEDIHDRVNFVATESELSVNPEGRIITLDLTIDTRISQVIEYFEIFLARMTACRKAAKVLGCEFNLFINHIRMA
jgi:hypothetical protein